jgi:hypothetical protein
MYDTNLDRFYTGKRWVNATIVRHDGSVVAFAVDLTGRIYYSVLNLDTVREPDKPQAQLDVKGWNAGPQELRFPDELVDVMPAASGPWAGPLMMPTVKRGTEQEAARGSLAADEIDPFLSTTARFTEPLWPFQVLSDGRYLLLFRQTIVGSVKGNAFLRNNGELTGDWNRSDVVPPVAGQNLVGVVNQSVLCDRFILAGSELKRVTEVRYQRSRLKFVPAYGGDTLGTSDLDGQVFYEPTVKLSFIVPVAYGGFTVAQLPTAVNELRRWQILAFDQVNQQIESYNLPVGRDGLFSVTGEQSAGGQTPEATPAPGFAGTAMSFDGTSASVDGGRPAAGRPKPSGTYTFEAWIKPAVLGGTIMTNSNSTTDAQFKLGLDNTGTVAATMLSGGTTTTLSSTKQVSTGVYTHVAFSHDGTNATIYLNGDACGSAAMSASPEAYTWWYLGVDRTNNSNWYSGEIDEARVWSIARTDFSSRFRRLTGIEPGLVVYFRMDEGSDSTVYDLTRNVRNGTVTGTQKWVTSTAPVGDGPGLNRDVFKLTSPFAAQLGSGLTSVLFFQQEEQVVGYGSQPARLKQQARLLVAMARGQGTPPGGAEASSYISVLDFAVTSRGRLGQVPRQLTLTGIGVPDPTTDQTKVNSAQTDVVNAQARLTADQALADSVDALNQQRANLYRKLQEEARSKGYQWMMGYMLLGDIVDSYLNTGLGKDKLANPLAQSYLDVQSRLLRAKLAVQRLPADKAALKAAQDTLATTTGGLQGGQETALAMPLLYTDRAGLSTYGAQLNFAWTGGTMTPSLFDSSAGDVVLYFRGINSQFFSAYYPATVARAVKTLTTADGVLDVVLRDPSATLSDVTIAVGDSSTADTCQVQITRKSVTETFPNVPRAAVAFAQVLTGNLPPGGQLGTAKSVQDKIVTLAAPLSSALTAGTLLTIGDVRCVLGADAAANATTLTVTSSTPAPALGPVRSVAYDYAQATCSVVGVSLDRGSLIISFRASTATKAVANGTAADRTAGLAPRWRGASPGRALTFNGADQYLSLAAASLPNMDPNGNVSVEAWINPAAVTGRARIVHAALPASTAGLSSRYTLGIEPTPLGSGLQLNPPDSLVCDTPLPLWGGAGTIEMWAMRLDSGRVGNLFRQTVGAGGAAIMDLVWGDDDKFKASWGGQTVADPNTFAAVGWNHFAIAWTTVVSASSPGGSCQVTLYRNGTQIAQGQLGTFPDAGRPGGGPIRTMIGPGGTGTTGVAVDEIRVWNRARTSTQILNYMNTRASGAEPGLMAYWSPQNKSTVDLTYSGYDLTVAGSAVQVKSGLTGYTVVAGVGDQFCRTTDAFPAAQWGHLALTFRQDWAVSLNGNGYADAGGFDGLNLTGDLSIEVVVKLTTLGRDQGLVGKGVLGSGKKDSAVPYAFWVQADGRPAFSFESGSGGGGSQYTIVSDKAISANELTKVAVVRRGLSTPTFYINGKEAGPKPVTTAAGATLAVTGTWTTPVGNDDSCEIGRYRNSGTVFGLCGTLTDVRVWNLAREAAQIGTAITSDAKGLVAWWTFAEPWGTTTVDRCGAYPATLYVATRVRTPDPAGNRLTLYHNGTTVLTTKASADPANPDALVSAGYGANQFTLSAMTASGQTAQELFAGTMDEVRLWRTERTQEQILDNMFCRLREDRRNLLAYYQFDEQSTTAGAPVTDNGLRGNTLTLNGTPTPRLSTAPIAEDTPQVRSALTGVQTPFNIAVGGTPSVAEYADMQSDSLGGLTGVMKRCYSYLRGDRWVLHTGFKVGDLITTWVAQAQFNPQVVGYIEGAPPVPSENLVKVPDSADYTDRSKVTFVQADNTTNTMSSSKRGSVDAAIKASFEIGSKLDVSVVLAPAGFGKTFKGEMKNLFTGGVDLKFSHGWTDQTQVSQSIATARTSEITLTGYWEDPNNPANPTVGQRWVPANNGFAIVQSSVADMYALRLSHNGAVVAYRMIPNPDIPPDWNIITFAINPLYTKQGTLDGLIGYKADANNVLQSYPDPSFPNAATATSPKGEYSYYRPREAARLKRRILREELALQAFYDDASVKTETTDYVYSQAEKIRNAISRNAGLKLPPEPNHIDVDGGRQANKASSRRNIVNTYVWTASGGLFAETTTTADQVTTTTSGDLSFNASFTLGYAFELDSIVAAKFNFDATMGAGYSATRSKTKDSTNSFSLNVVCNPNRNLQQYGSGGGVFDANNQPVPAPGRVDAYRFNTFYLDTSSENYDDFFGKVVDPFWLATSNAADAVALRNARQTDRRPPCWRILHRVTFVSRVLPASAAATPLQQAMLALGMGTDLALIARLQPYVQNSTMTTDSVNAATRAAIAKDFPTLAGFVDQIVNMLIAYYDLAP